MLERGLTPIQAPTCLIREDKKERKMKIELHLTRMYPEISGLSR
jgi:hypothetical protein